MDDKIYSQALERSEGLCEICGSNLMVQCHHIIKGKGKRDQCERIESVIFLCWQHHYGNNGIHGKNGHTLDLGLKIKLQHTYENMGMPEDEIREWLGGKLYI